MTTELAKFSLAVRDGAAWCNGRKMLVRNPPDTEEQNHVTMRCSFGRNRRLYAVFHGPEPVGAISGAEKPCIGAYALYDSCKYWFTVCRDAKGELFVRTRREDEYELVLKRCGVCNSHKRLTRVNSDAPIRFHMSENQDADNVDTYLYDGKGHQKLTSNQNLRDDDLPVLGEVLDGTFLVQYHKRARGENLIERVVVRPECDPRTLERAVRAVVDPSAAGVRLPQIWKPDGQEDHVRLAAKRGDSRVHSEPATEEASGGPDDQSDFGLVGTTVQDFER